MAKIEYSTIPKIIYPDNKSIKYFGRWDFSNNREVKTSWGAAYLKIRFKGKKCKILIDDGNNDFEYSIDNQICKILITEKNKIEYELADNLSDDIHTLIFTRRSHCLNGITTFKGFINDNFKLINNVEIKKRKLEFIGDSITAGCLNEEKNFKYGKPVSGNRHNENTNNAYGPILARKLNAEYSVIAIGGIGLYHNWLEKIPGTQRHIQEYFLSTLYEPYKDNWDFSIWQPDAVFIAAGTNDFGSEPIPDKTTYIKLYSDFINLIRGKYKNAFIFCIGPWKYEKNKRTNFDDCRNYIKDAVKKIRDEKIIAIDPVSDYEGPWLKNGEGKNSGDYAGDDTHPTVLGHKKIAEKLEKIIKKYLNW